MPGEIESGQLCAAEPVDPEVLNVGKIVRCSVNGRECFHKVKAIQGNRYQNWEH